MAVRYILGAGLGAVAVLHSAAPAWACPPPLPPPHPPAQEAEETADAYAARIRAWNEAQDQARRLAEAQRRSFDAGWEAALWAASQRVVLAEIVETGLLRDGPDVLSGTPEVRLRVIQVQRGPAQRGPFTMTYTGMTSCGPIGPVNVNRGNPGERFVIFARSGSLTAATTIGSYALADAQDSRTISLLESRMPPPSD